MLEKEVREPFSDKLALDLQMQGDSGDIASVAEVLKPYFEKLAKEKAEAEAKAKKVAL